jgi:hypothetical protein
MRWSLGPAALVCVTFALRPPLQGSAYRITDVRAHLYYPELGTFDTTNITSQYKPILWNTIIGEGRAQAPSQATLVLVQMSGTWLSGSKAPRLHVIVSPEGRRAFLDQTVDLSQFFSEQRFIWVPFIAFGTGCGSVRITSSLLGENGAQVQTRVDTIPFECGE